MHVAIRGDWVIPEQISDHLVSLHSQFLLSEREKVPKRFGLLLVYFLVLDGDRRFGTAVIKFRSPFRRMIRSVILKARMVSGIHRVFFSGLKVQGR